MDEMLKNYMNSQEAMPPTLSEAQLAMLAEAKEKRVIYCLLAIGGFVWIALFFAFSALVWQRSHLLSALIILVLVYCYVCAVCFIATYIKAMENVC
ncbi:MAG: hypothetical protein LBT59_28255 [Clostridiales bacterium]|jgi:hypothetical protein|nr:hypothetical protein [Clostridiales bacterium]